MSTSWIFTIVIVITSAVAAVAPYLIPFGTPSPLHIIVILAAFGLPAGAYIVGAAIQGLWNLIRPPARAAHNFHMRLNWTAAIFAALVLLGAYGPGAGA